MNQTDLAWAAGFIDGDGCISIDKMLNLGKMKYEHPLTLSIRAGNVKLEPLKRLQEIFGLGTINTDGEGFSHWQVQSNVQTPKILVGLLPYLTAKGEEAEIGLDFATLFHATKVKERKAGVPIETLAQRDAYYWALREAKEAGKL